ncbi:Uncharacterized conserved protein YgiB, involved in bioifilm formation, UPF0441/DUF1190 family [Pseudomonas asplenii]|uniref:Uncharacterized conserved protein YgiB, involved in bioifilm formation, UPF0441/DUF1190 family n=1 Tax=Pseudomonas asplenii TaxID=53407 RepID=A0A1H1TBH0_9PSED|nr:DUF1190 domain-containing protein [Pseudomonas asplenii]SDS57336.1 Uncharacterized conserved protein YgiB, involved in bioifilm formation, UPF0441/DUF1190 family [Pseudomonas asplenii]
MKRSQRVGLVLLGSVPFVLVACDGEQVQTRDISKTVQYADEAACVRAGVSAEVCADAAETAREQHLEIAPQYASQSDCASDFSHGDCVIDLERASFHPLMAGFNLTTVQAVPVSPEQEKEQEQEQEQQTAAQSSTTSSSTGGSYGGSGYSSHSNSWGSRLWRWIGLGSDPYAPRYFSEPLYNERDGRGGYQASSLNQQARAGKTFEQSTNARFRLSSPGSFTTASYRGSAPEAISRGGFGSSHGSSRGG